MLGKYCVLNGKITEISNASINPYDRGFMYGDGVFDTMNAPRGVPFLFKEHMQRLYDHSNQIEISIPYTIDKLKEMVVELLMKNGLTGIDSFVRTTITRGINAGKMFYASTSPTLLIVAKAVSDNVYRLREEGVKCIISNEKKIKEDPIVRIKSLNFLKSIMAMKAVYQSGADEAVFFNSDGFLTEGTTSNVFIIKNGGLFTPPDDAGLLPGITRDYLIRLLEEDNITVAKKNITRDELINADELFLTSSVKGVVPVTSIDEKVFKKDYVKDIQKRYFESIFKSINKATERVD